MMRMMRMTNLRREELGSELLETAMMMPIFAMLLFGIVSFGIVIFGLCNLTFASRAAARYASVHSNTSLNPATLTSVSAVVTPFLVAVPTGATTTTVTYSPAKSNTIGSTVIVKTDATYAVTMPFTTFKMFTVSSTAQRTITR